MLRNSSASQRGTRAISLVRGRRLCIDPAGSASGQRVFATPGCGELMNLGMLVSGWKWLFLSSCQELVEGGKAP